MFGNLPHVLWSAAKLYSVGTWGLVQQLTGLPKLTDIDMGDIVAVVTGAANGVGLGVAQLLVERGAHVIIADCDEQNGEAAVNKLNDRGSAQFIKVDLSSLKDVDRFVKVLISETNKLHILINNAAIMIAPYGVSEESFERHHAVNYLGHAYLTLQLLDLLAASAESRGSPSRVMMISSIAHRCASVNLNYLRPGTDEQKASYAAYDAYSHSKLCCAMFARLLQTKLVSANKNHLIIPSSVHPGIVDTGLYKHLSPFLVPFQKLTARLLFLNSTDAAAGVISSLDAVSAATAGDYFFAGKVATSNSACLDPATQELVWKATVEAIEQ